ncbi:MAG: hypothetical protein FD135_2528 [Comamonadaceae bacterium]|nr:MAG: hypothetical protein FD135_2528 [Comamonadaceae bacterium]
MIGGFTGGRAAVVAIGAVGGRSETTVVQIADRQPGGGFVTAVTGSLGRQVIGSFSWRRHGVVTCAARSTGHASVVELGSTECLSRMTGCATGSRRKMLRRFHHIVARQAQAAGVARSTISRRALEYAVDVTRLTPRRSVYPRQRETGCQMIKIAPGTLRQDGCRQQGQGQRDDGFSSPAQESIKADHHGSTPSRFVTSKPRLMRR